MEILARIIDSVAWPSAIIFLGLLFRGELRSLLSRVSSFKYKELEAKFEKDLDDAERRATEAVPEDIQVAGPTYPEPYAGKYNQLLRISRESPRAALLEAWIDVESSLKEALERHGYQTERAPSRLGRSLWDLAKKGNVSKQVPALFDSLRGIRNEAAHARDFIPSNELVERYLELAIELSITFKRLGEENRR